MASALGMDAPRGIAIEDLHAISPLLSSGLERGDVIVEVDGHEVNTMEELDFRTATKPLGKRVSVVFVREGVVEEVNVVLAAAPDKPARDRRLLGKNDGLPGLTVITSIGAATSRAALMPLRMYWASSSADAHSLS